MRSDRSRHLGWPLVRYFFVGLGSTLIMYPLYLALTWSGVGHMLAMSSVYAVGVCQTFLVNRGWTFDSLVPRGPAFRRYVMTYAIGYVVQASALYALVDGVGWPHEVVQGVLILAVAGFIFLLQRFWVFPVRHGRDHAPPRPGV